MATSKKAVVTTEETVDTTPEVMDFVDQTPELDVVIENTSAIATIVEPTNVSIFDSSEIGNKNRDHRSLKNKQ